VFQHPTRARWLVAAGMTGALLLLPGTAWAADDGTPTVPTEITDVTDITGTTSTSTSSASTTPAPPPFEIPQELEDAFAQFAEQAGISQECVDDVSAALEQIAAALAASDVDPAELEAAFQEALAALSVPPTEEQLAALAAALEARLNPPPSQGEQLQAGLESLAAALQSEECRPAPPAAPTSSAAPTGGASHPGGGHTTPPQTPAATTHPAPQAAPQTVTYLGYAPTGAERESSALVPVAALGSLALVAGAGALGYRRWRAPRRDG
jgi:hypothetical protein